jgi:hypothetical protein
MANPDPVIRSSVKVTVASVRPDLQLDYTERIARLLFVVSDSKYRYALLNDGDTF